MMNIDAWREAVTQRLHTLAREIHAWTPDLLYGALCSASLLPVVTAAHQGDFTAVAALTGVVGAVGGNLISGQIQAWKDRSEEDLAAELTANARDDSAWRDALDKLLAEFQAPQTVQAVLSEADRDWFARALKESLALVKSGLTVMNEGAWVVGDGNIIQTGDGAVATGGGAHIGGDVQVAGDFIGRDSYTTVQYDDPQARREQARITYLTRLSNRCPALPMAAMGGGEGLRDVVRLDQVYVEMDTQTPAERPEGHAGDREREADMLREKPDPLSALEAATREARLVLLGDPGGGKSTFIKQLAAWLAEAGLGRRKPPPGWSSETLPFFTNLRDLAPRLAALELDGLADDQRKVRLRQAMHAQWRADVEALSLSPDSVLEAYEAALTTGAALLIFDGLDEAPEAVRPRIALLLDALAELYPAVAHLIVTCRVRSYIGATELEKFEAHQLARFDEKKIRRFATGWYQAQVDLGRLTPDDAEARRDDLILAALSSDLVELSENPMLLTVMAVIHQQDVGLPRDRVKLYHRAVTVLLHRWQRHKGVQVSEQLAALLADERKMRDILERLAHDAHRKEADEQGPLRRGELLDVLEGDDYLGDLTLAGEFLTYVDEKAGVLVGQGGSKDAARPVTYAFPHRTFREYLAGCYLVSGRPSARTLRPYAQEADVWYLAMQLAGEELLHNRRSPSVLLDLMYALCPAGEPEEARDWRTALWAGHMAKTLGPRAVADDCEPGGGREFLDRLTRRMVALVEQRLLTPPERADAGRILSVLGDPRPGVGVCNGLPDIAWRPVEAGPFIMGSDKQVDPWAYEDEEPQFTCNLIAHPYRISRYQVTVLQYQAFVSVGGYTRRAYWTEAGWAWRKQNQISGPEDYSKVFQTPNHPRVGVSWYEAVAYCNWLSEQWGYAVRLPTEAEWERAARHTDGRIYSWNGEFDVRCCNMGKTGIGATSAVGAFPAGNAQCGATDMSGNVWEWCSTKRVGDYEGYEKRADDDLTGCATRVVRGAAFDDPPVNVRCASRDGYNPNSRNYYIGFRVVASDF
ncbi:MAG: SUMF1/EgtB/PvdO family nonheme iron enzyme [Caldilineaceae bacterium]|nr:SUMF1/EgtB/PvdO family nonheme iron enzyme [Caldilineaceae bacterium]